MRQVLRGVRFAVVVVVLAAVVVVPLALAAGPPVLGFLGIPSADFGTVASGSSTTNTYTVKNTGGSASGALKVSLSGASDFSLASDLCTATSLGPKKSCTVGVTYAPTAAGASDAATLTVSSKKPPASAVLHLTGATQAAPSCSDDFSGDAINSQPSSFNGGTIDNAYAPGGGIFVVGTNLIGDGLPTGQHVLYSGVGQSLQFTFTNPVSSVGVDAFGDNAAGGVTLTLTAYDSSNATVDQTSGQDGVGSYVHLTSSSLTANITHVTLTADDGLGPLAANLTCG